MATFKDFINRLDRDKEMEGFQITPGGFKAGIQRIKNAPKGSRWVLSPTSLRQGQQATQTLIGAAGKIKSAPVRTAVQAPLYAGKELMKTHERGFSNLQQGVQQGKPIKILGGAWDIAKTPLALSGGVPAALSAGAISGALGGGINKLTKGNVAEGIGKSFTQGLQTRGLTRFTDPVISSAIAKYAPKGASLLKTQLAQRGIAALGNVGEDELLDFLDQSPRGLKDRVISAAIGFASAGNVELVNRMLNLNKRGKVKLSTQQKNSLIDAGGRKRTLDRTKWASNTEQPIKIKSMDDAAKQRDKLLKDRVIRIKKSQPVEGIDTQLRSLNEQFTKQYGDDPTGTGQKFFYDILDKYKKSPFGSNKGAADVDMLTLGLKSKLEPETVKIKGESEKIKISGDNLNKYKSQIESGVSNKKSIKQSAKDFYTNWVNRFQPVEDLVSNVEKAKGIKIRPEYNPKYAISQFQGAGGKAELRQKKILNPILDEVKDVDKGDFDAFLKAQRDIELASRDVKGSNKEAAIGAINELSSKYDINKLEDAANKLYAYQRNSLNKLVEAGFLDSKQYQDIISKNKKYVPFERVMDEVDNYLGMPSSTLQQPTKPIKGIKGSEKNIKSPMESIIANTYKTEAAVAKNNVAKSISTLEQIAPETGIRRASKSGPDTISVWKNGKKEFYEVPKDISGVVKGLNEESSGALLSILSAPAKLLRQEATGRNIDFMIPNIIRDQFDAAINAKYGYVPFVDYFNGLFHTLKYKYGGGDELMEQYMNSGGKIFFENMGGRKTISKQISDATANKNILRKLKDWAITGIEEIGELSETPTRVGVFNRAMKSTGNQLIAGKQAREATLDFARMGAKMKTANSLIPFLNVGVQGFDKTIRTVKDAPVKTTMKLAAYAGIPALMTSLYNNLYHGEEYGQIPDFEKEGNYILITDKKDNEGNPVYIKIPKGNVAQLAANPTDHLVTWLKGNNPQTFNQMATSLLTDFLPVIQGGQDFREVASRTVFGNLPQAIKPTTEAIANYSGFMAKPIVPSYMDNMPPSEQAYDSTPELYKKAGRVLNVSPLQVKNFAEGTFAAGVKTPVNIAEMGRKGEVNVNNVPIVRRFVGSRAGYGIDRPEDKQEFKPEENVVQRFLRELQPKKASAASIEEGKLPDNFEDLTTVYKSAQSTVENYRERKARIEYGNYKDWEKKNKLKSLEEDYKFAQNIVNQVKDGKPEQYYEIQLDTYGKDHPSDIRVPDRAEFAVNKLKEAKTDEEKQKMINDMWESGVLTGSSNGVAQYIKDNFDIDVRNYTGDDLETKKIASNKISIKGSSGSRGKVSFKKLQPIKVNYKLPTRTESPIKITGKLKKLRVANTKKKKYTLKVK